MSARESAAGISPALDNLPPLPADRSHAQRLADLEARVEDLRGALVKVREVAQCDGSAPGLLTLVVQVANDALAASR